MWKLRTFLLSPLSGVAAFLTGETTSAISADDILGVLAPITEQFSVTTVVALIAGILGVGAAFVFLWWGVRKGVNAIITAVKTGKIHF